MGINAEKLYRLRQFYYFKNIILLIRKKCLKIWDTFFIYKTQKQIVIKAEYTIFVVEIWLLLFIQC